MSTNPSVFKVRPSNQLGIEHTRARNKLMAVALSKPELYYELRDDAYKSITVDLVDKIYATYWNLLVDGTKPDGSKLMLGLTAFSPALPESQAGLFALRAAKAVEEIANEAIDTILPRDFKDLAQTRSKQILQGEGKI